MPTLSTILPWFAAQPVARLLAGVIFLALLAWFFWRAGRGAGKWLFTAVAAICLVVFIASPALHLLAFLLLVGLVVWNEWRLGRRRTTYRAAIATVEGGGIKRGLTAPEAAVLLGLPANRALVCALAGLLKKGVLIQARVEPLTLDVAKAYRSAESGSDPQGRAVHRRQVAQRYGVTLHPYEEPFLELLEATGASPVSQVHWEVALKALVRHVAERIRGFDLSESREYYRKLIPRTLLDAGAAKGDEGEIKALDHHLEWLLLDEGASSRFAGEWAWYRPPWQRGASAEGEPGTDTNDQPLAFWLEQMLASAPELESNEGQLPALT